MRFISTFLATTLFFTATAILAQTPPSVATPVAPSVTPVIKLNKDGKPKAKEVRATCKAEAGTKGLAKGDAYKAFMKDCIGKQRPDLVKAYDCRQEAKTKNLDKDARKTFMKECRAK